MKIKDFFSTLNISAAGLNAQKRQLDVTAENIANASTTRTAEGTAYRRKFLVKQATDQREQFVGELRNAQNRLRTSSAGHISSPASTATSAETIGNATVKTEVAEADSFKSIFDPEHPDADAEGIVQYPDVNVVTEMLELISASRSYEANVTIMDTTKKLARRSLEI
jgi:flagellar basal-body rod protein FlgC